MRPLATILLGLLSGLLGLLAGWAGLAMLVIALGGPDRDGGLAMGAFLAVGPVGGIVGLALGVLAFWKFGRAGRRLAVPFAAVVALATVGVGAWGWWEFVRSPYLSHGYMRLALQFRLPTEMALPGAVSDVSLTVMEGDRFALISMPEYAWHGHDGNRAVILGSAILSYKAWRRSVTLALPGQVGDRWTLDLPSDPDLMEGFTPWRRSAPGSVSRIEMNYRLEPF